jgi:hypothetical protein
MYIKKVVVVGLLLANVSASHGGEGKYIHAAIKAHPYLSNPVRNAEAFQAVLKVGACLDGFDDSSPAQATVLALALCGKDHGLTGLEAFYGTATTESVVAGWVPSRESATAWASGHSRGLVISGAAVAAVAGVGAGYRLGWGSKLKGMLPGRK